VLAGPALSELARCAAGDALGRHRLRRDHGPGFSDDDLERVFDRFYRSLDARRIPGSGLGLAIVKQAAEARGGFATAANAQDGGAVLRISFEPLVDGGSAGTDNREPAISQP
jgi:nitrogen fixation/metabolism regulation signal transduction histidine kinase